MQIADETGLDRVVNGSVARIKTTYDANLDRDCGAANGGHATIDSGEVQIDRFFAEDRLSRSDRLFEEIGASVA